MKCRKCGAPNLTLEDEFCPYCGAVNTAARKHLADMKRFSADYESTKKAVLARSETQRKIHAGIIAICILLVLIILLVAVRANQQSLRDWYSIRKTSQHQTEIRELLDQYEEEGNFYGVSRIYLSCSLYDVDSLKEYTEAAYLAYHCRNFFDQLYYLRTGTAEYAAPSDIASDMGRSLHYFYTDYKRKDDSSSVKYSGSHLNFIEDMKQKIEAALVGRCGFTSEDIAMLPEMDSAHLTGLIEERMHIK